MKKVITICLLYFHTCLYAQPTSIILENGSYFNGKVFVPFKQMVINGGKIVGISSAATQLSGNRINLKGKFIIPGLVDGHVHIGGSPAYPYVGAEQTDNLKSSLHCGVTTVIDLFSTENKVISTKTIAARQPAVYSIPIMAGPILTSPKGHGTEFGIPTRTLTTLTEARNITNQVIDNGADVIKLVYDAYSDKFYLSKDIMQEIVTAAHVRHKKVFAHINTAKEAMDCIDAGVDVLAHMPVNTLTDAQIEKIKRSGIFIIPTVTVYNVIMNGYSKEYISNPLLWKTANPDYLRGVKKEAKYVDTATKIWGVEYYGSLDVENNLKRCIAAGIPILAGTDAGFFDVYYGYSLHNELEQYVAAGMTNAAAINSASTMLANIFPDVETGRIKVGYDADLVVLNTDPLIDITNTKDIDLIIHKGKLVMDTALFDTVVRSLAFDESLLENGYLCNTGAANVGTYSDSVIGGNSKSAYNVEKDVDGNTYLHLTGKVLPAGYIMFAGLWVSLSKDASTESVVDIRAYSSISFEVKGNGKDYYFRMLSANVKDYNYHSATFKASNTWATVTIPFSKLEQSQFYGSRIPLDLSTITSLSFEANVEMDLDFSIKNIRMNK
ncbi:hypothetical protein CJD36_004220 [Flavipsychrobacter stenotrophus]|uniref:Amidohydrolase n=1 Tax=Flavipsychrobacter stenotrophus TaxID=2077091 RepID=A0A2S7T284_9BACT|nr:CIA30 family protein [Flavipsychrobacter stenotrophus]PQJ12957.1 hypothetical protein CJD36_004220 [Flavipsychrobacter stenotrophus]